VCHQLCQDAPLAYYEVGHMMYIHVPSLARMKQDLAKFVRESSGA
jgi:carboxypeptidase C (cathepsin A)